MDIFGILNIPNWIIVFAVTFYICYMYLSRKYNALESLGVPGPTPLPLLGNSLQDAFSITHEMDIKNNKKYGRIYCFYEGAHPTLRVSDPAIVKEILVKQFNNFTDRRHMDLSRLDPMLSKMMSLLHGDEWRMTRNVMSPTFTSGKLKQMVSLIDKCSQKLVNILAKKAGTGESLDAKDIYIAYLLEIVGSCAFGVEPNEAANSNDKSFVDYARQIVFPKTVLMIFLITKLPKKILLLFNIALLNPDIMGNITKILRIVIKARESGNVKRNDFLQIMLDALKDANTKAPGDGKHNPEDKQKQDIKTVLTEDGVIAQSILFLIAGYETTSSALAYISHTAAVNPDCQEKLIEEVDRILEKNDAKINWETIAQMTYMDMFIAETLRMYPPLTRIDRQCTQDTQIGEIRIPKDTIVNTMVYAMHFDEEFYPDPYKFDPERFTPENKEQQDPYTYLSFGIGPRNCIGMRFALMDLKITLIHMLKNFRFCRAPNMKEPIVFKSGCMQLNPVGGIHVTLARR